MYVVSFLTLKNKDKLQFSCKTSFSSKIIAYIRERKTVRQRDIEGSVIWVSCYINLKKCLSSARYGVCLPVLHSYLLLCYIVFPSQAEWPSHSQERNAYGR